MDGSRQPFSWPVSPAAIAGQTAAFEQALTSIEATAGPGDLRLLEARRRLGNAYAFTGRAAQAISVLEANVTAAEKVRGTSHPNAVLARADLAWAWRRDGRVNEALAAHQRCAAELDRLLGPASVPASRVRIDLGRTLIAAHQRSEAIAHLEQALAALAAAGSGADPDALAGRMALATVYRSAGRISDALEQAGQVAAACRERLPADDPEALSCQATLATIRAAAGQHLEAVQMLSAARSDFERVLGPDHVETIRTRLFLADVLSQRPDTRSQAITEFGLALDVARRVLGPQHLLTVTGQDNLVAAYLAAGQTSAAISVLTETIRDTQPPYAGDTRYGARRILLAQALQHAGRTDDAIALLQAVIADSDGSPQPEADRTAADARVALAGLYASLGRDADAGTLYAAALPALERVYGPAHPTTKRARRKTPRPSRR